MVPSLGKEKGQSLMAAALMADIRSLDDVKSNVNRLFEIKFSIALHRSSRLVQNAPMLLLVNSLVARSTLMPAGTYVA
jgi:hypothetical protein